MLIRKQILDLHTNAFSGVNYPDSVCSIVCLARNSRSSPRWNVLVAQLTSVDRDISNRFIERRNLSIERRGWRVRKIQQYQL